MTNADITFPADGGRPMRAAYAAPADSQKHPGVIVIHEIFGLNDDIRRITGKVADLGYAARLRFVALFRDNQIQYHREHAFRLSQDFMGRRPATRARQERRLSAETSGLI